MTNRRVRPALAAVLAFGLIPVSLSAQRTTRRVFVFAADAAGAPVRNLTAADFAIVESGSKREVTRVAANGPMRIVLLVDSSSSMSRMLPEFRAALNAFIEALPPEHEVTFISTGGQTRIRTQPSTDRQTLRMEAARFSPDGGANAFLETMLEADQRFLKTVPHQWPAFVIMTTDNGETRREPRLQAYNDFMNDFLSRGGSAHSVIVVGSQVGAVTDITLNLVENMGGMRDSINLPNSLPRHLKDIAERLAVDHDKMEDWYEVEYTGDAKVPQPVITVGTTREGVAVQMSVRRPFQSQ